MQIIPFRDAAQWQEQISLTGNVFTLRFCWNALNGFWTMNMYDVLGNPIINGIFVVNNYDITYQFKAVIIGAGISFGDIVCIDYSLGFDTLTRYQLGQTADLFYYEPGTFVVTPAPEEE